MSAFLPSALETLAYSDRGPSLAALSFRRAGFGSGAMDPGNAMVKRATDIVLASIGLIVMSVPMMVVAAAIRLTSQGPRLVPAGANRPERPPVRDVEISHHAPRRRTLGIGSPGDP